MNLKTRLSRLERRQKPEHRQAVLYVPPEIWTAGDTAIDRWLDEHAPDYPVLVVPDEFPDSAAWEAWAVEQQRDLLGYQAAKLAELLQN